MALLHPLTTRVKRVARDERGFTIIEVLASAAMLAIVSVGLLTAFDGATKASGRNKARTVASQLAQADQERLRAMTGSQLATLNTTPKTTTKVVDGRTFTITSSAVWTNDPTGTGGCGGLGKEPGYQRITSSVTWPDRGTFSPVQADSLKAVPNGGYSTSRGSLAVRLTDRNGAATSGIPISISGPTSASASTSSTGCALFGFVPVGTYTITVGSGTTYVRDVLPNDFVVTQSKAVSGEQTSTVSLNYDKAASLGASFMTHLTGKTAGTGGDTQTTGDSFSVASSGLGSPYFRGFSLADGTTPASWAFTAGAGAAVVSTDGNPPSTTQKVLYPFTSYRMWAGGCQSNDPKLVQPDYADPNASPTITQGGAMPASSVLEPQFQVTTKGGTAEKGYFLISPVTQDCSAPVRSDQSAAVSSFQTSLPYGGYTVCVQDKPLGQTPTKAVTQTGIVNKLVNANREGPSTVLGTSMASLSSTNKACS